MNREWRSRSVRVRLTVWYAGALTMVLLLYAGGVFVFLRRSLFTELDDRLHEDFEVAEQMLERTAAGVRWRASDHHEEEEGGEDHWLEVWSPAGALLYGRASEEETARVLFAVAPSGGHAYHSLSLPEVGPLRTLSGPMTIDGLPVIVRVARSEARLRHELNDLLLVLGLGLPMAIGLASLGGYGLARRALAPVGQMAERARTITAERLGERLPVVNPEDELGHLAIVFNETFTGLEQSFAQLRRFTADASHELRTPLTAIRSVGEVGLREHRDEETYREIIGSMLEEADRLGHLVDSLLTLSRADVGQMRLTRERVDLVELVREVTSHLGVLAEEKRQSLVVEADAPVYVPVDRLVLRQAVINVVDNAIKYSPEGGHVRVVVREQRPGPTVEVIDTGPGIAEEHHAHIFDRFYRVDKARSREMGGTGLGLAIARWAVDVHGGRLEVKSKVGAGSTFRIQLPRTHTQEVKGATL